MLKFFSQNNNQIYNKAGCDCELIYNALNSPLKKT